MFSHHDPVVRTNKTGCKRRGRSIAPMCYTRRDEAAEYEALRRAEKRSYKQEQTKQERESREKKPLTKKAKEMVGAR